jgi:GT2 family glycosyltransferase
VISAIVPTFRGQARLDRNLASVAASLEATGGAWEILVVDDGGGGITPSAPHARVVSLPANRGYGPAVNAGAAAARGDSLLVLNDDVRLEPDTVARLGGHFPSADLFAVAPAIRSPLAVCGDEGGKAATWTAGLVEIHEAAHESPQPTFYAVGCCFLCPRAAWEQLGGYDDVFAPFLSEDVDLSYRAWRAGWRVLHDPVAVCHHEGSATIAEHHTFSRRETMGFRNRVLFHLRNIEDAEKRAAMFGALAAYALLEARPEIRAGLADALARDAATPRRPRANGRSDEEILRGVSPR